MGPAPDLELERPLVEPLPPSPSGCSTLGLGPATNPSREIEISNFRRDTDATLPRSAAS
jgi:hypothetical protein